MTDKRKDGGEDVLKMLLRVAEDGARENFEINGELLPLTIAHQPSDDTIVMIGHPFPDRPEHRDLLAHALRRKFVELGVDCYVMVTEVWFVTAATEREAALITSPSKSERRQEAVHLLGVHKSGTKCARMIPIERDEKGARLGPSTAMTDFEDISGRFADLLG